MFEIYMNDGENVLPEDNIFYIIAKNGIFIKRKNEMSESISKVDSISILKDIDQYAKLNINKIKAIDFNSIVEFFRAVYKKYSTEAIVTLYYNKKSGDYKIEVPKQEVSTAGIKYKNKIMEDYENWLHIGTVHSHGGMGAFHSSVDQADEKDFDGLHITVGNVVDDAFSLSVSVMENSNRFLVDPSMYIYGLREVKKDVQSFYYNKNKKEEKYIIECRKVTPAFDPSWMNKVTKDAPVYNNSWRFYSKRPSGINSVVNMQEMLKRHSKAKTIEMNQFENPCKSCIFRDFSLDLDFEDLEDDKVELVNNWEGDYGYLL